MKTAAPGRLLTRAAGERHTGTLVVGGHPGGMVHLLDGAVIYAESPAAPGVGELLTASGRLAGRIWQAVLDTGAPQVGQMLLDQGHLTRGELELCVLGAIYDAGYFALSPSSAPVEFRPGAAHWLGPVIRVDPAAITREARRRAKLLDEIHPHPRFDTAPVSPVPRAPVERIVLTALQWELLIHADGQRTPADLAQLLGRAGFATIQQVRGLAAQGLIELPTLSTQGVRVPHARGASAVAASPVATQNNGPQHPVIPASPPTSGLPPRSLRSPRSSSTSSSSTSASSRSPSTTSSPSSGDPPRSYPGDPPTASSGDPPTASSGDPPTASSGDPPSPSSGDPSPRDGEPFTGNGVRAKPVRLARRKPGARLPKDLEPSPAHTGTDEVLLKRIRTALQALR